MAGGSAGAVGRRAFTPGHCNALRREEAEGKLLQARLRGFGRICDAHARGRGRLSLRARAGVLGEEGRRENFCSRSWAAAAGFALRARAGGGRLSLRARAGALGGAGMHENRYIRYWAASGGLRSGGKLSRGRGG